MALLQVLPRSISDLAAEPAPPSGYDPGVTSEHTVARSSLILERDRLRAQLAEEIQSPGQMTYGSQAAAASQVFEQQRDLALRERNLQHLAQVEDALARLDAGTFGMCTRCGNPIAPERLEAIPWAALCIDCQRLERRT
jgi:RNA polymerase-binding protein DksA